jgi:acetyl-CoA carboxylase carboxyl transferase subunit beta
MGESPIPVRRNVDVPEGLWIRCVKCGAMVYRRILEEELRVCPECDYHYRIDARTRLQQLNDPGTFEEFLPIWNPPIRSSSPTASATRTGLRRPKPPRTNARRLSSARASSKAAR